MNETDVPGGETSQDLVTLTTAANEFQASVVVVVLREAGVEAFAFGAVQGMLPLSLREFRVPVQVRRADLERARLALQQNISDSIDLDWDQVDVGEREDALPLRRPGRMPLVARLGFYAALTLLIAALLSWAVTALRLFHD